MRVAQGDETVEVLLHRGLLVAGDERGDLLLEAPRLPGGRPMLHNVATRWDIGAYVLIGKGQI